MFRNENVLLLENVVVVSFDFIWKNLLIESVCQGVRQSKTC